jgi:hypothetical protein
MKTIAERNRKLKQVCVQRFGKGKVKVRGSRGTGYGWVTLRIFHGAVRDLEHRRELEREVWSLIRSNNIEIDKYGYDDPGSDYGYGSKIHIHIE